MPVIVAEARAEFSFPAGLAGHARKGSETMRQGRVSAGKAERAAKSTKSKSGG
jgi:hypothetical protein